MPIRRNSRAPKAQTLKQIPLFSACSNRELRRIASVTTEIEVKAGQVLTAAGEPGAEFFVVMTGAASVWQHGVPFDSVGPGSFFGEVALDRGEQTATIVSETDMRLLVLTRREFTSTSFSSPL